MWMFGAEHLLAGRQRTLVQRLRPRKVALLVKHASEVVEAQRRRGMLGSERLLADRQHVPEVVAPSQTHPEPYVFLRRLRDSPPYGDALGLAPFRESIARAPETAGPPQGQSYCTIGPQ